MNPLNRSLFCLFFTLALTCCTKPPIENQHSHTEPNRNTSNISQFLQNSNIAGFEQVLNTRKFLFPEDHGPHPSFRTEWWYVTGNLSTLTGRHFGFQITFFRRATNSQPPKAQTTERSHWTTNQIYMAHFAISDLNNDTFYSFERFSRASLGLAGAQAEPFKVWLLNWSLQSNANAFFPLTLKAGKENIQINIDLTPLKPMVLQGRQGLSQKSASAGNASYYYAYTRLSSSGEIKINNESFSVTGNAWFDREWSTSALAKNQLGWDWFALQLANGDDIMFYQLRNKMNKVDPNSQGTYIMKNGDSSLLHSNQVSIQPLTYWRSKSGVEYPASWTFTIPDKAVSLHIQSAMNNQEINHSFRYWEGAVKIRGTIQSKKIRGRGYVELSGY